MSGDSASYLAMAEALGRAEILATERTPGYPLLLVGTEALGRWLGASPLSVTLVLQVLLLTGAGALLLHGMVVRATGQRLPALLACALYLADADTQSFGAWIMTEPLALFLLLAALWLRQRDDGWARAGWVVALLVLTRPIFVFMPPLFALVEVVRRRRPGAAASPLLPTVALGLCWVALTATVAGDAARPIDVFLPRHAFAKVYDFDLWTAVPDSPVRRLVAEEKARGSDVFRVLDRLAHEHGPDAWAGITWQAVQRRPGGLVLAILRALPRSFRQATLWKPDSRSPIFVAVERWHAAFWGVLFWPLPMLLLSAGLVAAAATTGFGWPSLRTLYAWTILPLVLGMLATIAVLAQGTDGVGRYALGLRPWYFVALACAATVLARRATASRSGTARRAARAA